MPVEQRAEQQDPDAAASLEAPHGLLSFVAPWLSITEKWFVCFLYQHRYFEVLYNRQLMLCLPSGTSQTALSSTPQAPGGPEAGPSRMETQDHSAASFTLHGAAVAITVK